MNPFETFIEFRRQGLAVALIEAFAELKKLRDVDPRAADASLRAIALSLPPTPEWSGLSKELKVLLQTRAALPAPLVLTDEQKEQVKARLAELHRKAAAPGGWTAELEAEFDELMSNLSRR